MPYPYDDRGADERSRSSIRTRTTTQRPLADVYEEEEDEYETEPVVRPTSRASRTPQQTIPTQRPGGRPQSQMQYYPEDQPQPRLGRRPRRVTAEDAVILEGFADRAIDPRDRYQQTPDYAARTERFTGPQMPAVVPERPDHAIYRRELLRKGLFGLAGVAVVGGLGYVGVKEVQAGIDQNTRQLVEGQFPTKNLSLVCGHHDSPTHKTKIHVWIDEDGYVCANEMPGGKPGPYSSIQSSDSLFTSWPQGDLSHVDLELKKEPLGAGRYNIIIQVYWYDESFFGNLRGTPDPLTWVLIDNKDHYSIQSGGTK